MTDNPYLYHAEKIVDISQHLFLKEKKPRKLEIETVEIMTSFFKIRNERNVFTD